MKSRFRPQRLTSSMGRDHALSEGQVEDATASFAEGFRFKDHGIELEFTDKGRLTEFFQKARELIIESGNTTFINATVLDATNGYADS